MTGHRNSIFLESAEVLGHDAFEGDQYILRVRAPKAAASARAGAFAHVRCAESIPMRRPLSIMRVARDEGWIEMLYKPVGDGLRELARTRPGDALSVLAPIGNGFSLSPDRPRLVAIGGGVGIPPMLFLAETLDPEAGIEPLVLMGSEVPFPFELSDAAIAAARFPEIPSLQSLRALAALEQRGIASVIASNAGLPGAYSGHVPDLARMILMHATATTIDQVQIAACGPEPMLHATARLAAEFNVPCQLALEEYMACGVGGCAGCTVAVHGPDGVAMKRVCVDGPVFEASQIYPVVTPA